MNDLIIVGGGLAGLAAATWCAREGLRVVVLERAGAVGGRARTDVNGAFSFNLGGHALYVDGHAARGLHDLGVDFHGSPPPTSGLLGIARGKLHRFPAGLFSMLSTDLFGFGAKIEAARALAILVRTDPRPLRDVPWSTWLARLAPRREVRDAIAAIGRVTTYANAPDRASAGAVVAQIQRGAAPGVLYLHGGWQTLVDGLERAAVAAGVRFVRVAPVTSLDAVGSGAPSVTVASGERVVGRTVLLAAGPATARVLLRSSTLGADLVPTRTACLDLGLASLPHPERLVAFGLDEPTYFSVHSAVARLARRGAVVHLMKYLDPDAQDDPATAEAELEQVADRVQAGWRDRVVARRFMPSLVSSNALVAAGTRRPAVDATGVQGVFLAGDWIGDDGMLADASIASARAAAARIVAHVRGTHAADTRAATMAAQ